MDLATGLMFMGKGAHQMPEMVARFSTIGKIVMIAMTLLWVILLLHCLNKNFKTSTDKIAWVLVLLLVPGIGALMYLFAAIFLFNKNGKK